MLFRSVIHMSSISGQLDYNALNEHFSRCFPDKDCFLLLKNEVNSAVFLVNDNVNSDSEKPDQHDQTTTKKIGATLSSLLYQIYEELDVMSAISQSSSSPLDIPSLYENALSASEFWPDQPVVFYETLPNRVVSHDYPYSLLQQMKESLEQYDFLKTRYSVDSLFRIIDNQIDTDTGLTEFYIQCILIDMLTNLVNCMNQNYVSFNTYNELYFTTLNLCRSCIYQNNAQEISSNVHALLDICEREIIEKQMTAPFKQVIEECYTKPDFSLSMLADRFHVSSAYMSQWFKLELNCNFSEYLWSLRLNKAQELLRSTNMSIDEISVAVGYMNTSSFRRKYKQETGLTPSQYRTMNSQTT